MSKTAQTTCGGSTRSPVAEPTDRTKVRRLPDLAVHDREKLYDFLDRAFVGHLGVIYDGSPRVIPTIVARWNDSLVFHASVAASSLRAASKSEVCLTISIVDGLVLAADLIDHTLNYRSVMVFGVPREARNEKEARSALRALTEHVTPGRWDLLGEPSATDVRQTRILLLDLDEWSMKMRSGPPSTDAADVDVLIGVVPICQVAGTTWPDDSAGGPDPFSDIRLTWNSRWKADMSPTSRGSMPTSQRYVGRDGECQDD